MNKELLKLKKILTSINEPTREELICKSLRKIFHDEEVGITEKEAFDVLTAGTPAVFMLAEVGITSTSAILVNNNLASFVFALTSVFTNEAELTNLTVMISSDGSISTEGTNTIRVSPEIYIGTEEPTDENILVWYDTDENGESTSIDSEVSETSTNAIENQAITKYVNEQIIALETRLKEYVDQKINEAITAVLNTEV